MDLTIIIVNWNTRELLRNCLGSIERWTGGLQIQTIVVDNRSRDGSAEMVTESFPRVELIQSGGNIGFARANNLAVPKASGEFILFLNPDTELREGALLKMVQFLRSHTEAGALGCKILNATGEDQELGIQCFPSPFTELLRLLLFSHRTRKQWPRLLPYHDPKVSGRVKKLFGACLMVRRTVLQQVGSFDEIFFMYCEDVDLCQRIQKAGWTLHYLSEAEILHLGASASAKAPGAFAVLMTCQSLSLLMRKYYGRTGSASYRLAALLGSLPRLSLLTVFQLVARLRVIRSTSDLTGSARKYATIARWALGLERPSIRSD